MRIFASSLFSTRSRALRLRAAFSLLEVLVVVALLSFIILGLMMMFGQVQRAYKLGTTQVDVMESGRMLADQFNRELVQATPSYGSNCVNFYAQIISPQPLLQTLSGMPDIERTNLLSALFFLTRQNQRWTGIGYLVADTNQAGMGTLYRYELTAPYGTDPALLYERFYRLYDDHLRYLTPIDKDMNRMVEGVVGFTVRAYDPNGVWLTGLNRTNLIAEWPVTPGLFGVGEMEYYLFRSNAIPASVEVELGVLEDATVAKARAFPTAAARRNFLKDRANSVHVFRTRTSLRNVDPVAYP